MISIYITIIFIILIFKFSCTYSYYTSQKKIKMNKNHLLFSTMKEILFEKDKILSIGKNMNDLFEDNIIEILHPKKLEIIGNIPPYVKGILIRNGPSVFGALSNDDDEIVNIDNKHKQSIKRRYTHIFDGLAKLTKYHFHEDGNIYFSMKFIESKWHRAIVTDKQDIPPAIVVGTVNPPYSLFQRIQGALTASTQYDNACVNIHQIGGTEGKHIVAVTDAPFLMEFKVNNLDTIGKVKYPNSITSFTGIELFSTAHPQSLIGDCYSYNYYLELKSFSKYNLAHIVRTDKNFHRQIVGTVEVDNVPYIHDFSITNKYAILFIYPLTSDLKTTLNGKGFLPQLNWNKNQNTKVYVFNIEESHNNNIHDIIDITKRKPIASFETIPIFAYHHINAYEKYDSTNNITQLTVDITAYDSPDIINGPNGYLYIENIKNPEIRGHLAKAGKCYRFNLPIKTQQPNEFQSKNGKYVDNNFIIPNILHNMDQNSKYYESEMVTINPNYKGKVYRYSYGTTMSLPSNSKICNSSSRSSSTDDIIDWSIVKQDHYQSEINMMHEMTSDINNNNNNINNNNNNNNMNDSDKLCSPSAKVWSYPNCYPSEAIFIPNPLSSSSSSSIIELQNEEDDGVLISQVYDGNNEETFLLVLNAQTMQELARVYTGVKVPVSFHGKFLNISEE